LVVDKLRHLIINAAIIAVKKLAAWKCSDHNLVLS